MQTCKTIIVGALAVAFLAASAPPASAAWFRHHGAGHGFGHGRGGFVGVFLGGAAAIVTAPIAILAEAGRGSRSDYRDDPERGSQSGYRDAPERGASFEYRDGAGRGPSSDYDEPPSGYYRSAGAYSAPPPSNYYGPPPSGYNGYPPQRPSNDYGPPSGSYPARQPSNEYGPPSGRYPAPPSDNYSQRTSRYDGYYEPPSDYGDR